MRKFFLFIFIMFWCAGCRAYKEAHSVSQRDLLTETNIEARHLDSVALSENFYKTLVIEFFPPSDSILTMDAKQEENEFHTLGAVRRVTLATGRNATVARAVVDSVSAKETRTESDFKSVDESVERTKGTLPLMVGIIALIVAVCCLITYKIRK